MTEDEVPGGPAGVMRPDAGGAAETRPARTKISPELWAKAEAFYRGGASGPEVSARFGIAVQTIYSRMKGRGKKAARANIEVIPTPIAAAPESELPLSAGGEDEAVLAVLAKMVARWMLGATGPLTAAGRRFLVKVMDAWEALGGSHVQTQALKDGRRRTRREHAQPLWDAARRDYEEGDFTKSEIALRYRMTLAAVQGRARREGWSKKVTEAPAPLHPLPDPAQVDELGEARWPEGAHAAQLAPEGAWATWLFQGGRGAGKTRAGAEWIATLAEATPGGRFALVAATEHDLREVMIEGPSGLRSLPGRETPQYEVTRRKLKWKNGAVAYGFSAQQPERLRGPQFMAAWVDEFCAWRKPDKVLENLRMGLRMGDDPRLVVTTTPKPIRAMRNLIAEASCVVTRAGTAANAANLAGRFLSGLEQLYGGTTLAEQEIMGVLVEGDGALWKAAELARCRGAAPPRFERVMVGLDPPAGMEGSACGIVVAGRFDGRVYVLADRSVAGLSPLGWAHRVKEAVEEFGAVRVIAEGNQGGEMVRQTLLTAGVSCAIELVHAGRSKRARAEPVYALYEQGRVTHCGAFEALEQQLMAIGGTEEDDDGLDRADALVWALLKLLPPPQLGRPHVWRA